MFLGDNMKREKKFNQSEYANKWTAEKKDRLSIFVDKGQKAVIKDHASRKGLSINSYVVQAINDQMTRDDQLDNITDDNIQSDNNNGMKYR